VGKFIFWIVVVFGVLFALRLVSTAKLRSARKGQADGRAPGAEAMVRCQDCGVFLPRADAIASPDGFRCAGADCASRRKASR
jgi:hypothetical protein